MRHAVGSAWPLSNGDSGYLIWPAALAASFALMRHAEDEMVAGAMCAMHSCDCTRAVAR
jgi:hypothetical protein